MDERSRGPWLVRQAEPADARAMLDFAQALFAEPGLYVPIAADEFTLGEEEERAVVERHRDAENAVFLLALTPAGRIAGMLNASGSSRRALRHAVEFGMSVGREYRSRGVGSALVEALLDWARGTGLVTRIELRVYEENQPAIALYRKFGFQLEGRRQSSVFQGGRHYDDLMMALLL